MQKRIDEFMFQTQSRYITVSFRNMYGLKTNFATHDLYPYPAKFIPHVVRFFLEKYTNSHDTVFDPFAGSGTVAIEAEITGRKYIVWDLNPIIEILVKAETWKGEVNEKMFEVEFEYRKKFIPQWKNLAYWYPKEFLDVLSSVWGYYHERPNPLVAIPLFKISKYFSYAELQFPKLHKSKVAVERINNLLRDNWREMMKDMYWKEVESVIKKVKEFQSVAKGSEGIVKGGVDVLKEESPEVDAIITSPPYLQAQEYIRSFKLELFWLGYTEEQVKELGKKEIPYNAPSNVEIYSKTYTEYLRKVKELNHENLLNIYTTYFKSLVHFVNKVKAKCLGIFVGPVKVRGMRIPIDEILKEHLEYLGWKHESTYIDTILSRRIKKVKANPATGLEDERTPTEHLLVMKK
ncbi:MAG: DNA methyltransferase [Saccharolobus sp.]|uniref:DNA methyltransferase n=1 Tax=Saccharolobus TaxID=2100760 RepID=UPI001F0D1DDE|nr:DNA methyltransferase [Saccharolobus shibatae]MCH4816153.1 DNA adenine methylase [Saccharolobus shibatae]